MLTTICMFRPYSRVETYIGGWSVPRAPVFLLLPYDCLLHHIEDYAIFIFVRHAQRIVKPKFKSVSKWMIINNNKIWIYNLQLKLYTVSCHCLDYTNTILALKASGMSISTMSGANRFQSRTALGKNDIFLVSIREDGIWNDLLCPCLVFRPVRINLFSLLMATSSLSILYSITSLASFLLSASGLHFSLCMMLFTLDLFLWFLLHI